MRRFFQSWMLTVVGVMIACYVVQGIRIESVGTMFITAFILGFLNAFLRPLLMILAFPLMILTLGLFTFVLNGLLFYFTSWLVDGFYVDSFFAAFNGGLVISVVSMVGSFFLPKAKRRDTHAQSVRTVAQDGDRSGPIIDV